MYLDLLTLYQINLSEYRNRAARRPVERKGSGEKVSTPPNTPGTPAFLTAHSSLFPPTTTSAYTPLLQFPSGATSSNSDTVPQFEPVSPDEDDHASKLPSRDGRYKLAIIIDHLVAVGLPEVNRVG